MSLRSSVIPVLAPVLLALGCSTALAQTTVTMMHVEQGAPTMAAWEKIAADFEAVNPGVDVQIQYLENEAFKAKLPTMLQSDERPDIFYSWGGGVLKEQSTTGTIMDLTEAMDADGGAWRNSFGQGIFAGLSFGGRVWAVPYKTGSMALFYNKEQFAQAGVDAEAIKTWDDLLAAVQTLKAAGLTPIACGSGDKWPIHQWFGYLVVRNAGQAAFEAAKAGEGDGFAAEPFVKAAENLRQLGALEPCQPGHLAAKWPEALGAFADGKASMILGFELTYQNQRTNAADDVGIAYENLGRIEFPVVEGGAGNPQDTLGRLNGWAVSEGAPPEAIEFLKFFNSKESQSYLASEGLIIPVAVGAEAALTDDLMRASAQAVAAAPWHQNFLDQDLGPSVGRVVNDISVEVFEGNMTPQEGVQAIQDEASLSM
jgi:raffinose/stachyose/melibiose transport system substrate-binding protein